MIHARLEKEKPAPLWAAIGAPLLGVPLMVALLALMAPGEAPSGDPETGFATEQVEVQSVDRAIDGDCVEQQLKRG